MNDVTPPNILERKQNRILIGIGVLIMVLIVLYFSIFASHTKYITTIKKERFNYRVLNKFIDNSNHASKSFVVDKNGIATVFAVNDLGYCYDFADIGDTIYKEKNSLQFLLKKKNIVDTFYPYDTTGY